MKAKKLKCPYCAGIIEADISGRDSVFCTYCGEQIGLDSENREYTYTKNININKKKHNRYTNDADVIREIAKDKENKRGYIYGIVMIVICLAIFGGLFLKDKLDRSVADRQDKVSVGYYRDLLDEDYKTVEAHFRSAGFSDIELIDLDDAGITFWKKGKVQKISIAGDTTFDSNDYFDKDAKVVISYH